MRCANENCPRRHDGLDDGTSRNEGHHFAGYGYAVGFHPECCPREMDGMTCDLGHPGDPEFEQGVREDDARPLPPQGFFHP